ncbi:tRNA pseudouridine synthase B [Thraustotheca clavata]|uniref:tRNA pseudouridine(55) synthase n=1 Tax=Thraustotheca clavata TaxID=74557 RepID=A0A1W0A1F6_9STRA|nr:tRNA pseudouridine synthase B [Thraustotheca clavata]
MNGFVNLNKPMGMTSHSCVAKLRRLLKTKQVGHAGTLDPMATGVLPIAVNRATKFIQYLEKTKAYNGTIRFGVTTDTDDITGFDLLGEIALIICSNILKQNPAPHITEGIVQESLPKLTEMNSFVGKITQRPPVVSAIRVDGERLYNLARDGKATLKDVPLRQVTVHSIDVRSFEQKDYPEVIALISVVCSEGTYIRSIARECGESLQNENGTGAIGATLSTLHRTRSNGLFSDTSLTFEMIEQQIEEGTFELTPIEALLTHLPSISMTPKSELMWHNGQKLTWPVADVSGTFAPNCPLSVAVYCDGTLKGITTLTPQDSNNYSIAGARVLLNP